MTDPFFPKIAPQRRECRGLAATRRYPYLAHIGYMKIDEVAKGLEAGDGRACRRQPLIDPRLSLAGLGVASSRRRNVSLG